MAPSAAPLVTLQDAINSLYRIAVTEGKATSTQRLARLAEFCRQELEGRGLGQVEVEAQIPGGGRPKEWDVAWKHDNKYRLGVSLKSLLANLPGTVPNRIDDLVGEVANVQMYSPEIVVGYIMVFNVAEDMVIKRLGITWCDLLQQRLNNLSGRRAPYWSVGTIEAAALVRVNFAGGPSLITGQDDVARMFDELVAAVRQRNPGVA